MTDGRHTNTRERILDAALDLMSERGYGAVSVRDLADAVGIKGASLYKHFAGKREAFDALIAARFTRTCSSDAPSRFSGASSTGWCRTASSRRATRSSPRSSSMARCSW